MIKTWMFWRAVLRHPWVTDLTEVVREDLVASPMPRAGAFQGAPDAHTLVGYRVEISFRYYTVPGSRQEVVRIVPIAMVEAAVSDPFEIARDLARQDVIAWIDDRTAGGLVVAGNRWSP